MDLRMTIKVALPVFKLKIDALFEGTHVVDMETTIGRPFQSCVARGRKFL